MLKQLASLVVILACLACFAEATNWRQCSRTGQTTKFTVQGCEGLRVCPLRRGKSYWVEMQFRGNAPSGVLTASVIGKSRGMSSPMPLSTGKFDSDACNYLQDAKCPVARGGLYTYKYPLYIEQFFPATTYMINYALKDASGKSQACARLVIRVL